METKYKWGESINLIDWKFHGKTFKTLPQPQKAAVCKGNYNWRPTNKRMYIIEPVKCPSPMCPVCEQEEETNNHVYNENTTSAEQTN